MTHQTSDDLAQCRRWVNLDRASRRRPPSDDRFAPKATEIARRCNMSRGAMVRLSGRALGSSLAIWICIVLYTLAMAGRRYAAHRCWRPSDDCRDPCWRAVLGNPTT
jgi:hypothetical protein